MTSTIIKRLIGVLAAVALAVGMTAAAASPAEAKKRSVWDKVARCESGSRWKINTGNGYYGGLQFSGGTWRAYGGKKYGRTANKATKGQQIAIARRVLAGQGPGAWGSCGRKAGLTKSNGKASRMATPSTNPGNSKSDSGKSKLAKKKSKSDNAKVKKKKYAKVRSGDTLGKIANRYHVKGGWKKIWKLNKKKLKSAHHLKVGKRLRIR